MHTGLLTRYFGTDRQWRGPCTVILDAEASPLLDRVVHGRSMRASDPKDQLCHECPLAFW